LKGKAKENSESKDGKRSSGRKRLFAYSFFLMDLKTRMYIAYGSSTKSEREAYDRALAMLRSTEIVLNSLRLEGIIPTQAMWTISRGRRCTSYPGRTQRSTGP
jgi:transposase